MSNLNAARVQRVELHWPRYGSAWAKVATDDGTVAAGPATLTVGGLAFVGTVTSQSGEDGPAAWSGIWVQGAAWGTALPTRPPYQNDGGVRLKTILADLATDCKAAIVQPADLSLGTHWTRPTLSPRRAGWTGRNELDRLVTRRILAQWWIDPPGVTRFSPRIGPAVTAPARVTRRDLTRGWRHLGIDTLAPFAPGGTFEGATIERLVVHEDAGSLTCEAWTS